MSKGSGGTRSSSSKSPSSLALSAVASSATTSMKVGGVSPELARARQFMKDEIGHSSAPIQKVAFNEKTNTLTVNVVLESRSGLNKKGEKVVNGKPGTTRIIDSSSPTGMKGADMTTLSYVNRIGDKFKDAGHSPKRIIIKETYAGPEKWESVSKAYKKKWQAKYGK